MNVHDSEKMLGILYEEGYQRTDHPGQADLIIFNTCSIRQKAEQKFYSELGRIKSYKQRRPEVKIAIAGCIAQQEGKKIFSKASHVDYVFGPQNIHSLKNFISDDCKKVDVEDNVLIATENLPVERNNGIKAWVTVMYGCNNFCSYCVVPYTRGRERSRPSNDIYAEVSELSSRGFKEITLLGQNVNSYRSDTDFSGLLKKLSLIDEIRRIRFVTSHPKDLSDNLIRAMSELSNVCEHIHLPLQSGSGRILKGMNRGYTYDEYMEKVLTLRKNIPGIAITSDIITGFPGETDEDHMLTVTALKEIGFEGIFAFKFSPRPGTKAAGMEDLVLEKTQSERLHEILRIQDAITEKKNKSLEGTMQEILIEGNSENDNDKLTGRTRTNKIVNIPGICTKKGALIQVEIIRGRKHSLEGVPV